MLHSGSSSWANPIGGQVTAGSASFEGGASALTIRQSSDRGIIHWQDFSIGHGESVKFLQPGASAAILNRVTGGKRSDLLGTLEANGSVYLINPSGVLVGGGAVIDTNSFIASTLDVIDADFMAGGDLKFIGASTASVTNLGKITARGGDVFLIANTVENAGSIDAANGTVGLAAGQEVLLKSAGDERLFVAPTSKSSSVHNSGTITGATAELKASGNLYALAINNTGTIRATGMVNKNGRVILSASGGEVRNSGTIGAKNADGSGGYVRMDSGRGGKTVNAGTIDASGKAPGAKGGQVEVLGNEVELSAGSLIDVAGDTGGGVVLVGGEKQGANAVVQNSKTTKVAAGAAINADAVSSGDGGTVIVWADETTDFAGHISARGGAGGGNGGFAEVSGKLELGFHGVVDLSAPAGLLGTLLLDPKTINVQVPGGATPDQTDDFSDDPDQTRNIDPAMLIASQANVVLQANSDINFNSSLILTAPGASLTAQAGRAIRLDAGVIVGTNSGAINLIANETEAAGVIVAQRDGGNGVISMHQTAALDSNGGDITLEVMPGLVTETNQFLLLSTINAGAGTVTLRNHGSGPGQSLGEIVQSGGGITAARAVVEAPGTIQMLAANNVGTLILGNRGRVDFLNTASLTVGDANGGGPVIGKGPVTITTSAGDLTLAAEAFASHIAPTGVFTLDAAQDLFVRQGITSGSIFNDRVDAVFRAGRNVTITAPQVLARDLAITATTGAIAIDSAASTFGISAVSGDPAAGNLTLTAALGATATATSSLTARALVVNVSAGSATLAGPTTADVLSGTVSGALALTNASNDFLSIGALTTGGNFLLTDTLQTNGLTFSGKVQSTGGDITIATAGLVRLPTAASQVLVGAERTITLKTNGQILDDAANTPSFIGGKLALLGSAIGGGTSNPLNTQVSRLEARARPQGGFGGFLYIVNQGALEIGGVSSDPDFTGLTAEGKDSTGRGIFLRNDGSITLQEAGDAVFSTNNGNIFVETTRRDADIKVATVNPGFLPVAFFTGGTLTLNAGRALILGDPATRVAGSMIGRGITLNAGGSILVNNLTQVIALDTSGIAANAVHSIRVTPNVIGVSTVDGAQFRSTSGDVRLTAQFGALELNNGSATYPVVRTNDTGLAGKIELIANTLDLSSRVDAGGGNVFIRPVTVNQPIFVGIDTQGALAVSDAELDLIRANSVFIGDGTFQNSLTTDGIISRPTSGPTYERLVLRAGTNAFLNGDIMLGAGGLAITGNGNLSGFANISAGLLTLNSAHGNIALSGNIIAAALSASAIEGNLFITGAGNNIAILGNALYNQAFRLTDSAGGLRVTGFIDGGNNSRGTLEVRGGRLTLGFGAKVFFHGAGQTFRLFSDTGFFNEAGSGAIVPEQGARYLIYVPDNAASQLELGGLTPNFTLSGVSFTDPEPSTPGNGLLIAAQNPANPLTFTGALRGGGGSDGTAASGSTGTGGSGSKGETSGTDPGSTTAGTTGGVPRPTGSGSTVKIDAFRINPLFAELRKDPLFIAALAEGTDEALEEAIRLQHLQFLEVVRQREADKQRRLAMWPPEGGVIMDKGDVRKMFEKDFADEGGYNKDLYWKLLNMPEEERRKEVARIYNAPSLERYVGLSRDPYAGPAPPGALSSYDKRVATIILSQSSIAFTDYLAKEKFLADRGNPPKLEFTGAYETTGTRDANGNIFGTSTGIYFVWLPAAQMKPILPPSAPAPVIVTQPPAKPNVVAVILPANEVNADYPPPK